LASELHSFYQDKQNETLYYQIVLTSESVEQQTLADIFYLIENNKSRLNIEAYSLSQTTLEDVFLSFARLQKEAETKKNK
jgi:hypothetical protein